MDPLTLLREFCSMGKLDKVTRRGNRIEFGDQYSFEANAQTALKDAKGRYYNLADVYYFIKSKDEPFSNYLHTAADKNLHKFSLLHRKDVTDYLIGKADMCPQLEAEMATMPFIASNDWRESAVAGDIEHRVAITKAGIGDNKTEERNLNSVNAEIITRKDAKCKKPRVGGSRPSKEREWSVEEILAREVEATIPRNERLKDMQKCLERFMTDNEKRMQPLEEFGHNRDYKDVLDAIKEMYEDAPYPDKTKRKRQERQDQIMMRLGKYRKLGDPDYVSTRGHLIPIVIVPSSEKAVVSIWNIKELLEDANYIFPKDAYKMKKGEKRVRRIQITRKHKRPGDGVKYEIRDYPPSTDSPDWKRVIAVVAEGMMSQFHRFPFTDILKHNLLISVFSNMLGVYFKYNDEHESPFVKKWDVECITIDKNFRHGDTYVRNLFFQHIDTFISRRIEKKIPNYLNH